MMDWLFAKRIVFLEAGPAMDAPYVTQVAWKLNFMTENSLNMKILPSAFYFLLGAAKFSAPN